MKNPTGVASPRPIHAAHRRPPITAPTRNPVTVSGLTFRAKFKSLKGANPIKAESLLELRAADLLEFAKGISHISYQPKKLRIRIVGRWRHYTPDFSGKRVTRGSLLVEVKPQDIASLPEMRQKFEAAADAARSAGDRFIVLTERQIYRAGTRDMRRLLALRRDWVVENLGGPPIDETIEAIAASIWSENNALREAFSDDRRLSVAATLRLIGGEDAQATLDLLLTARVLAWPIAQELGPRTLLNAYTENDDEQLFV